MTTSTHSRWVNNHSVKKKYINWSHKMTYHTLCTTNPGVVWFVLNIQVYLIHLLPWFRGDHNKEWNVAFATKTVYKLAGYLSILNSSKFSLLLVTLWIQAFRIFKEVACKTDIFFEKIFRKRKSFRHYLSIRHQRPLSRLTVHFLYKYTVRSQHW